MEQQAGNIETLYIQRLLRVLFRRRLFIGVNQYTTLPFKAIEISKRSRQVKKKRIYTPQIFFTTPLTTTLTSTHTERNIAILKPISHEDPRGHRGKKLERQQLKPQQYARLMDIVERFQEIMKLIIEEEKKKPKVVLLGYDKEYQNKDDPAIFYTPKKYHPTPTHRSKDMDLSDDQ
ncbi:MAG: hypothetical protein EZS28_009410 [Streblomastix strix]|uniref:Uncharacterized protein n=1 Tax=Streblomastix strix TaxID=222440 RepID=A0A5J4WJ03_9EUKA|nr:MAG: hypothetical protein EZS28_009410 [Streblomastix strix]